MKGSNDHVTRPDYYPNLDHLEWVGKQAIKKEGQRRRVQDDQRSNSFSAEELKIAMLAPPWIPISPPRYGGIETAIPMLTDKLVDLPNLP